MPARTIASSLVDGGMPADDASGRVSVTLSTYNPPFGAVHLSSKFNSLAFDTNQVTKIRSPGMWGSGDLVSLFQLIGTEGTLRIGGSSGDSVLWGCTTNASPPNGSCTGPCGSTAGLGNNKMPVTGTTLAQIGIDAEYTVTTCDIDNLAAFLNATGSPGWKATWGLNICLNDPSTGPNVENNCNGSKSPRGVLAVDGRGISDADIDAYAAVQANAAAYIAYKLGPHLSAFEIGNEPPEAWKNMPDPFKDYEYIWSRFRKVILARVPGAKFVEPADLGFSSRKPPNAYVVTGAQPCRSGDGCVRNSALVTPQTVMGSYHIYRTTQGCNPGSNHCSSSTHPAGPEPDWQAHADANDIGGSLFPYLHSTILPAVSGYALNGASLPYVMGEGGEFDAKTSNVGNEYGATLWYINFALINAMFGSSGVYIFNEWSPMGINYANGSVTQVNPLEYAMYASSHLMNATSGGMLLASNVTGLSSDAKSGLKFPGKESYPCRYVSYPTGEGPMHPPVAYNGRGKKDSYTTSNFCAWGVAINGGGTNVILVNNDYYNPVNASITFPNMTSHAVEETLSATGCRPSDGMHVSTCTNGVTFGGSDISPNGEFHPKSTTLSVSSNIVEITVPPGSAVLIEGRP
ncbi:glycosyl hydrolase family 79 C-terminal domain-containing protein [Acidisarcina polymorpha]|nr:glycosyl hydrolase family 79 C-terminal domain-containing protein [Acidisarcina polymorpha]